MADTAHISLDITARPTHVQPKRFKIPPRHIGNIRQLESPQPECPQLERPQLEWPQLEWPQLEWPQLERR